MASVNKVIVLGNLGRDPETRYMPSGDAMTTLSIATTDSWKDKASGEKKESTEWHRVTFFGKLAEIAEYCCYDVKITKLVHEYGAHHKQLHYNNRFGKKLTVPVNW